MKVLKQRVKDSELNSSDTMQVYRDCGYDNGQFAHIKLFRAEVDVRTINSDIEGETGYQRRLRAARVNEIVNNFHPIKLDPITIAIMPNGERKCLDGQARTVALRILYKNGIISSPMVDCKVIYGATPRDLAEIFSRQDEGKTNLSPSERTNAELGWKDPIIRLNQILDSYGINLMNDVRCHQTIKNIFNETETEIFERIIYVITASWNIKKNKDALSSKMLNGLSCFYNIFAEDIDDVDFVKRLTKITPERVFKDFEGYNVSFDKKRKYLKTFSVLYNNRRKTNRIDYV